MKQAPILLVVAGIALGIFAWSRFSGSSRVPLDEPGRAVSDSDEEQLALNDGSDSGSGSARARRSGSQAGGSGSPFREKRIGRDLGASGSSDRGSGGSADTYSSGSRDRKGRVGVSASGRSESGGGSSASLAGRGGDSDRGLSNRGPERSSDVRDFLNQQAASQPRAEADEDVDDVEDPDGNSEVVFNAPLNREHGTDTTEGPPPLVSQDLNVDDSGEGIKFGKDSVLAFPDAGNLKNEAGTITFEFEPEWEGGSDGDYNFVNVRTPNDPRNLLRIYKNGRYLRFLFADDTGRERNIGYDMIDMEPGGRHRVTATFENGQTAFYVDGQLVGTNSYEGQLQIPPGTPMYVGSDVPQAGPSGAGAIMSNVQVYGRALGGDEVSSLPIGQIQ